MEREPTSPEPTTQQPPDAPQEALLRDLLALSALPSGWLGQGSAWIASSIAGGLERALDLDLVLLRFGPTPADVLLRSQAPHPLDAATLERAMDAHEPLAPFPLRVGERDARAAWLPLGPDGREGRMLVAAARAGFPAPQERLLLGFGANQCGVGLAHARLQAELLDARQQAAQTEKLAALGQLVAGVAHEIRTPLTYASTNLTILDRRLRASGQRDLDDVRPLMDGAQEGIERIERLVDSLRRFLRQEPRNLARQPFDRVVYEAITLFRATHKGSCRVEWRLESRRVLPLSRTQLQQVVINLLENAAAAMPHGGVALVETRATAHGVELIVADEGIGMDDATRARIFDPLFTTKTEGTGLGLAIVRRAAHDHGGNVEVDSAPGKGTCFRVRFPLPRE